MFSLKLHTKVVILISVITVAVMGATVLLIGARMAALVQQDEKELARLHSISVAEQISLMSGPLDTVEEEDLVRAVEQARGAHPNLIAVRIWKLAGQNFQVRLSRPDSPTGAEIPSQLNASLRNLKSGYIEMNLDDRTASRAEYRVFAPIVEHNRLWGLVEVVEKLDTIPTIVRQYAQNALWLTLIAVTLITLATYLSFRTFVYRPLENLLKTISLTADEEGIHPAAKERDEFSQASREYNRMLERVQELSQERERQQELLRVRVREATEELQQRNSQLAATNNELWETSRRLSQMERLAVAGRTAAQFAHEVGTPLNSIGIHLEIMRDTLADQAEAVRRIDIISEQIERIAGIVRESLDRTQSEKPELRPLDLRFLLERICETTGPTMEAHNVRLLKSLQEPLPTILGNAERLQQVFFNLINNALDAMPSGGQLRIAAALEQKHQPQVVVSIEDTGCGIQPEIRARIFDPLYTTKERGRGTGLGLVVVKQIMEEHNGVIILESEPGRGSQFHLSFPAAETETVTRHIETKTAEVRQ